MPCYKFTARRLADLDQDMGTFDNKGVEHQRVPLDLAPYVGEPVVLRPNPRIAVRNLTVVYRKPDRSSPDKRKTAARKQAYVRHV